MKKRIEYSDKLATNCKQCNRTLTNPGYNKQSKFCCGKYRRWYDCRTVTIIVDDGRDDAGRFHHKPKTINREIRIDFEGGN